MSDTPRRVAAVAVGDEETAPSRPPTTNGHAAARASVEPSQESADDYLAGLVSAALDKRARSAVIEIVRTLEGEETPRVLFRFGVRMLDDREDLNARERHVEAPEPGDTRSATERTDWIRYRCQVIYDATQDEDTEVEIDGRTVPVAGKALWQNKGAWRSVGDGLRLRVVNPVDFIYHVLLPEEKDMVYARIGDLSKVNRGREVKRALFT